MRETDPCILIFTRHGLSLARRIAEVFQGEARILAPAKVFREDPASSGSPPNHALGSVVCDGEIGVELYEVPSAQLVGSLFSAGCPLIGIASVGLMLRLIAPHVQAKAVDPPVAVVDEAGRFVVPILSGHLGGGNALAERIAAHLGAIPVVTTATEALGTLPIDRVAAEEGWRIEDLEAVKAVARCLVNGEPVAVVQEWGDTAWRQRCGPWPASIDFVPSWEMLPADQRYRGGVLISDRLIASGALRAVAPAWVVCRPRSLIVGVGAEKGVPAEDLDRAVCNVLSTAGLTPHSVAAVATLDRKAAEEGFRAWLAQRGWPVVTYTAAQLAQVDGLPNPSAVVAQAVGTPGVCEPAALLASGGQSLLLPKSKQGRVTVAVARKTTTGADSQVSLHLGEVRPLSPPSPPSPSRGEGGDGGEREMERRKGAPGHTSGRLTVIGIGPGAADLLTVRAIQALERADAVVGYTRYIQLLGDRVIGKEIHASPIGQEMARARLGVELARHGKQVALISSGDAGIYGMAGLVFEHLAEPASEAGPAAELAQDLRVEVVPGVTAAQAAASLLGAPLANDFAVLSLSDLLTPRQVVEQRLEALAAADLVVALYNPQSQRRRALFQYACQAFLRYRSRTTPVAVVKSAYRDEQAIQLSDLGHLSEMPVDMESLVLIGNSQTQRHGDRLVTARGYATAPSPEHRPFTRPADAASSPPKVLFVGAGPGDPELLTLRGAHALAAADVVVYAGSLVPRGVLRHVRPGARIHNSATLTLEDTHRLLTDAYRAGQRVVRLHSGDPSLYGAITEQMALLDQEEIPHEIVPGVSAFQAVAARLGIEYTLPGVVQTLILTRAGGRTGLPPNESLAELARHGVTLCLFLSARHVTEVQETLLTSYAPTTPVAVAYRATWPDEELVLGTLAELAEIIQHRGYERTALIVVGPSLQPQGTRSRLYDPSHWHLFRPEKSRARRRGKSSGEQGTSTEG